MKDTKRNLWIAHRNLEIACWEDKLTEKDLSETQRKMYRDAIEDAKRKLGVK